MKTHTIPVEETLEIIRGK
ncbi:Protein of unknown function [Bacillus toyonensis]|nr:Protein of unknown function [Bacillus toyonensis]